MLTCSSWCSRRHPQKNIGPPSPPSSPKLVATSTPDLVTGECLCFPVCITSSASPFSSNPFPPCPLSLAEVPHHHHPSSSPPTTVMLLLSSFSDHPIRSSVIPSPSQIICSPPFPQSVAETPFPSPPEDSPPPMSPPLPPRRHPC